MWSLPDIKRLNDNARIEAPARRRQCEKGLDENDQPAICAYCEEPAAHHFLVYHIFGKWPVEVLHLCDEHRDSIDEQHFFCDDCHRNFVKNYTWELYNAAQDWQELCLNCHRAQVLADPSSWIGLPEGIEKITDDTLHQARHLLAAGQACPKELKFAGNAEFDDDSGGTLVSSAMCEPDSTRGLGELKRHLRKLARYGYTRAILIVDAAYQFANSIGVYGDRTTRRKGKRSTAEATAPVAPTGRARQRPAKYCVPAVLEKRPTSRWPSRKVARNTYLEWVEGEPEVLGLRLHQTHVVKYYPNNTLSLHSGGYKTVTTKERINLGLGATDWHLFTQRGIWYLGRAGDWSLDRPFAEGAIFNAGTGRWSGLASANELKWQTKLRKLVGAYAGEMIELLRAGKLPAPDNGDCWDCLLVDKAGQTLGRPCVEVPSPTSQHHILGHLRQKYYVPSLLVNAMREGPTPPIVWNVLAHHWSKTGDDQDVGPWLTCMYPRMRQTLRRYLLHQLALSA